MEGDFIAIDMSFQSGMALSKDGEVHMWGTDRDNAISGKPANLGKVKAISYNYLNACVILEDDTLQCWGNTGDGLDNIPSGLKVKQVSSSYDICWMTFTDEITCIGKNDEGTTDIPQLDNGLKWEGKLYCGNNLMRCFFLPPQSQKKILQNVPKLFLKKFTVVF